MRPAATGCRRKDDHDARGGIGHGDPQDPPPLIDISVAICALVVSITSVGVAIVHGRTMERMADANARLVADAPDAAATAAARYADLQTSSLHGVVYKAGEMRWILVIPKIPK